MLHPKRSVIDLEFAVLEREVGEVFRVILKDGQERQGRPRITRMNADKTTTRDGVAGWVFSFYKRVVSPVLHGVGMGQCLYLPTCSEYAYVAVRRFGVVPGDVAGDAEGGAMSSVGQGWVGSGAGAGLIAGAWAARTFFAYDHLPLGEAGVSRAASFCSDR